MWSALSEAFPWVGIILAVQLERGGRWARWHHPDYSDGSRVVNSFFRTNLRLRVDGFYKTFSGFHENDINKAFYPASRGGAQLQAVPHKKKGRQTFACQPLMWELFDLCLVRIHHTGRNLSVTSDTIDVLKAGGRFETYPGCKENHFRYRSVPVRCTQTLATESRLAGRYRTANRFPVRAVPDRFGHRLGTGSHSTEHCRTASLVPRSDWILRAIPALEKAIADIRVAVRVSFFIMIVLQGGFGLFQLTAFTGVVVQVAVAVGPCPSRCSCCANLGGIRNTIDITTSYAIFCTALLDLLETYVECYVKSWLIVALSH